MTLIGSVGSCCFSFFFPQCCFVVIGTMITTVDGDEKGLVDDSGFNTRCRDTGADKERAVPKGSATNKVLVRAII